MARQWLMWENQCRSMMSAEWCTPEKYAWTSTADDCPVVYEHGPQTASFWLAQNGMKYVEADWSVGEWQYADSFEARSARARTHRCLTVPCDRRTSRKYQRL